MYTDISIAITTQVFSTLEPDSPKLISKVQIYSMNLFLIDHVQSISSHHPGMSSSAPGVDSREFWKSLGFALIGQCLFFELESFKSKRPEILPLYDLTITNNWFYLETCSDSFQTLLQLAGYLADNGDMPIEKKKHLERLAGQERFNNSQKNNVIYPAIFGR